MFGRIIISLIVVLGLSAPPARTAEDFKKFSLEKRDSPVVSWRALESNLEMVSLADSLKTVFGVGDIEIINDTVFINAQPVVNNRGLRISGRDYAFEDISRIEVNAVDEKNVELVIFVYDTTATDLVKRQTRNRIAAFEAINLTREEFIRGDALVFWGDINIPAGEVNGDVVTVFGNIHIGKEAVIRGNVMALNGTVEVEKEATLYGRIHASGAEGRKGRFDWKKWYRTGKYLSPKFKFAYNRVDGATAQAGFRFLDEDSLWPEINVYGGYALASERWRYHAGMQYHFKVRRLPLSLGVNYSRQLKTEDFWLLTETENTLFALLATEDYGDFYEAQGLEISGQGRPMRNLKIGLAFSLEEHNWLDAHRNLWSLFGGSKRFPANFRTFEGAGRDEATARIDTAEIKSLQGRLIYDNKPELVGPGDSYQRLNLRVDITPSAWNDSFDFSRFFLEASRFQALGRHHVLFGRGVFGTSDGELPIHRAFYLGGLGTLMGYQHKEYAGAAFWLVDFEYGVRPPRTDLTLWAFYNLGQITPEAGKWDDIEIKQSLGLGLSVFETLRLNIAQRLDKGNQSPVIHVRLVKRF